MGLATKLQKKLAGMDQAKMYDAAFSMLEQQYKIRAEWVCEDGTRHNSLSEAIEHNKVMKKDEKTNTQ